MKKYTLVVGWCLFLVSLSTWAESTPKAGTENSIAGVAYSHDIIYPILESEMAGAQPDSTDSYAPALFAMGLALDSAAQRLNKFERVPHYRLTRVMRGLLDTVREKPDDAVLVLFGRLQTQLAAQCAEAKPGEPCFIKMTMNGDDWHKPLANWKAPASKKDRDAYDDKFIESYFPEINDRVEELSKKGHTVVMGDPLDRDPAAGEMSLAEKTEMKKNLGQLYHDLWMSQKFVETPLGWYWAEPVDSSFIIYPWGDVVIRSREVPATYQDLLKLVDTGLNQYYLRQKREEIFWSFMSLYNNDVIKVATKLLDDSGFYWVKKDVDQTDYAAIKSHFIENLTKIKTEKSDMVARMMLQQSLVARMDKKDRLYETKRVKQQYQDNSPLPVF